MEQSEDLEILEINFCLPVRVRTNKNTYIIYYDGIKNQIYTQIDVPEDLVKKLQILLKPQETMPEIPDVPEFEKFEKTISEIERQNDY